MGLLLKKQHLPPLLKRKKPAFTSFASKIGIYLGTPTLKKTAFTSFAQTKKIAFTSFASKTAFTSFAQTKKTAFTSFASKIGIYLGTTNLKKTAFTSLAQRKKKQNLPPLLQKSVFT